MKTNLHFCSHREKHIQYVVQSHNMIYMMITFSQLHWYVVQWQVVTAEFIMSGLLHESLGHIRYIWIMVKKDWTAAGVPNSTLPKLQTQHHHQRPCAHAAAQ